VRVLLRSRLRSLVALIPSPCILRARRPVRKFSSSTMQTLASTILLHTRPHPEMSSVMRALDGAPTIVEFYSMRYQTSLGVPWQKMRRESPNG
jgi:hypothetical protein